MTRHAALVPAALLAAVLAGCASKPESQATPGAVATSTSIQGRDRVGRTDTVQMTAIVDRIDVARREVTVRSPSGRRLTFEVSPEVRNLPQVKRGDVVTVTYVESLVFQVRRPGEATPGTIAAAAAARAPEGAMPAGAVGKTVTVTTTVEAIDKAARTITLKMADGETRTLPVHDPANLEKVKVGDMVDITYSEAFAVSVEPPAPPASAPAAR
jgi:Cu/Ag efflux protein CusF